MEEKTDQRDGRSSAEHAKGGLGSLLPKLEPTQPPAVVYHALLALRCKYSVGERHQRLLEECDLVGRLIPLLQRPNSKIVDVSLSVLGNLVMHSRAREQARGHNAVQVLVRIISTLADEKILGRACRVIANLSQDPAVSEAFLDLNAVPLLLRTLEDVGCPKAKGSAIRAIRILCSTSATEGRTAARENQVLSAIASHLSSNDAELLKVVCKSLSVLTSTGMRLGEVDCIDLERLVELADHEKKSVWVPALIAVANASADATRRPNLGKVGAITAIVRRAATDELSAVELSTTVKALCLYCQESVNRVRLREAGGLDLFASLLSDRRRRDLHEHIVFSLLRFGYDAISLMFLARDGIVDTLTRFVEEFAVSDRHIHQCGDEIAESAESTESPMSGLSSPASTTSSAVSDAESMDVSSEVSTATASDSESSLPLPMPALKTSTRNSFSSLPSSGRSEQDVRIIDFSLQLLLRLYEVLPLTEPPLAKANVVKVLVSYVCWSRNPSNRALLILNRISRSIDTIKPFLLQGLFPWMRLEIDSRFSPPSNLSCNACQELRCLFTNIFQDFAFVAETGYVEGAVCHTLVKGSEDAKRVMTVGTVALVGSRMLLFNILVNHGGLDVLLEVLERETGEMFSHAVLGLGLLAERLDVRSRIDYDEDDECFDGGGGEETDCFFDASDLETDVELVVDDGTRLEANRRALIEANGVFEAMLAGTFSESTEAAVQLQNTNGSSLRCLVHHLYGCSLTGGCPVLRDASDVDTWLDLVPLSDKYLLPAEFGRDVCRKIIAICTADSQKMVHAYRRSLSVVCPARGDEDAGLNVALVAFLLVGRIPHTKRVGLFEELAKSEELKSDFLDDISNLVVDRLKAALQAGPTRKLVFKSAGGN